LVRALVDRLRDIALTVSHTTRQAREGEIHGEHYHFVNPAQFKDLIEADQFVEHATVFGHSYGTSRQTVEDGLALEIDWQGAQQVKAKRSDAISIFILPPSRQTLDHRLRKRAKDSDRVIADRLATAQADMKHHATFDYLVINDDFETAVNDLVAIVRAARLRTLKQRVRHAALIDKLLA